jgi:hypothetical protein
VDVLKGHLGEHIVFGGVRSMAPDTPAPLVDDYDCTRMAAFEGSCWFCRNRLRQTDIRDTSGDLCFDVGSKPKHWAVHCPLAKDALRARSSQLKIKELRRPVLCIGITPCQSCTAELAAIALPVSPGCLQVRRVLVAGIPIQVLCSLRIVDL